MKKTSWSIWLVIFFFGSIYSAYSIVRHLRLESFIFDLGVYDQIIWLASQFKPLYSSVLEAHPWGDHFTPTLLLLAPLYWVWDNVIILLLFQAFFVVLGAYPIYLLALKKLKKQSTALILAFAYLTFYGTQNALAFDFHPIVLATTLLAYLFYFYEEKKFGFFWPIWILFLGLQENFFLLSAALGIFLVLKYRDWRRGGFIFIFSLLVFGVLTQIFMPHWNNAPFTYNPNHLTNVTPIALITMFFSPFTKIEVIVSTFLAFGFLPILSPVYWVMFLEEYVQRFLGTAIATRWNTGFQYNVILAPIAVMATIEAIKKYLFTRQKLAVVMVVSGLMIVQTWQTPALNDLFVPNFYQFSRLTAFRWVAGLIPSRASVAAANNLGPWLTHREKIIFLTNCRDNPTAWQVDMKRCFHLQPEYLVADLSPRWNNFYPDTYDLIQSYLSQVQADGSYRLVKQLDTFYLLERIK